VLPNFIDFVAGVTHKKYTVNDMFSHYMQRQQNDEQFGDTSGRQTFKF